jgi:hypothetical protein
MITAGQIDAATLVYRGDWDGDGVTIAYLPTDVAVDFLVKHGWVNDAKGFWYHESYTTKKFWETGEAMQIAIAAMAS